jgi:oligopeptide/dipeptide ABC transporter ATP-binding protein
LHPYTEALISAVPMPDPDMMKSKTKIILKGELPSLISPIKGCIFNPRCPYKIKKCEEIEPELIEIGKDHYVACHLRT